MEWRSRLSATVLHHKENIVNVLLIGAFAILGARSVSQQNEIDALEVEKDGLQASNRKMQKSMWEWRESLQNLYEANPSESPISLSKLRSVYGEDDLVVDDSTDPMFSQPPLLVTMPQNPEAA
ncbi:hypothetical protein ZOSMA_65G00530 [Zostera marina]|uniref:Uncharacterized protein n=1 Tax=Zostera marina TaxID=29655 RepID=A0A0K9NSH8_ZOSMR|nr:hypothetical protein ZOSMA_65G00530 [Zostera marina]